MPLTGNDLMTRAVTRFGDLRLGQGPARGFRHQLDQYAEARDCHRRALALCRELGNCVDEAEVLASAGDSALADRDLTEARPAVCGAGGASHRLSLLPLCRRQ